MTFFSGYDYFIGAIYQSDCRFGRLSDFLARVGKYFRGIPFKREDVLHQIDVAISDFRSTDSFTGANAERIVILDELQRIKEVLNDQESCKRIEDDADLEHSLEQTKNWAIAKLREFGFDCPEPRVYLVDCLPQPYDRSGFAALCADLGDLEKHSIQPGIYFLKDFARPIYTRYLLLHEIIHFFLGIKGYRYLARGLEEGVCEIFGAFLLSRRLFGAQLTRNLFVYNRLSAETNQFLELYLDYARQAATLFRFSGINGLVELVQRGREEIKTLECLLSTGQKLPAVYSNGRADPDDEHLINHLVFCYGRHLFVSPLAFVIHPKVQQGATINEIASQFQLSPEDCRTAVRELQDRIYISKLRSDEIVVAASDAAMLAETKTLRYVFA